MAMKGAMEGEKGWLGFFRREKKKTVTLVVMI